MNEKVDSIISITGLCIGISGLRKSRTEQFKSILVPDATNILLHMYADIPIAPIWKNWE